jgi:hypothetical protein
MSEITNEAPGRARPFMNLLDFPIDNSAMDAGKTLIFIGAVFIVAGLVWLTAGRLGLGHLPGGFIVERGGFRLYLPIGTSIAISLVLTGVLWLIGRF